MLTNGMLFMPSAESVKSKNSGGDKGGVNPG